MIVLEHLLDGVVVNGYAQVSGVVFEQGDKFFVFDVVRQIVGHDRPTLRVADQDPIVRHQAAGDADIGPIAVAIIAGAAWQEVVLRVELVRKRVIEIRPLPPEKANAQLPLRIGHSIKLLDIELQIVVQMLRKRERGPFADADDADVFGAQHRDRQLGKPELRRDRGQKAGAAATQDEKRFDALIHRLSLSPPSFRKPQGESSI